MKKKKIAIYISAISMENQRKLLEGILSEAKRRGILCYIFTCHLNYVARVESQEGAYNILRLADFRHFDGVIFCKNTIQYSPAAKALEKRIRKSGIPCVCVDAIVEVMSSVMVKNYEGMYALIEYLITQKGAKTINFVSGYSGNLDGEERMRAYRDCLKKHDLLTEEMRIFHGNYSIESGGLAILEWEKDGLIPDAVVCANDQEAIGAMQKLLELGYKVPDDVMVTGFDGDDLCKAMSPSITTVGKKQRFEGERAVALLADLWEEKAPAAEWIDTVIKKGASTEGGAAKSFPIEDFRKTYVDSSIVLRQSGDYIRNMASDLAETEELEGFYQILYQYIGVGDMGACYICMCDIDKVFFREDMEKSAFLDIKDVNTSYTGKVTIPVGYRKGQSVCFGPFSPGKVLPKEIEDEDGADFYVVTPIHYRNCCYGYCVSSDSSFALESELFFTWVSNVGVALENIRKYQLLNRMMGRLNDLWIYDPMTKLYNRAGFFHIAREYFKGLKEKQELFVLFIDLDGLKKINDTYGHEMGDAYISAMADVIRRTKQPRDIAMRYGGDEYVIMGKSEENRSPGDFVQAIEKEMQRQVFLDGSIRLEASMGLSVHQICDEEELKEIIHQADERMYQFKKQKRGG